MKQDVSNELLGAYVDDELACAEKRALAEQIKSDADIAERAQALLDLKTSIKAAYPESLASAQPATVTKSARRRYLQLSVAASFIMGLGVLLGITLNKSDGAGIFTAAADKTLYGIKVQPLTQQQNKVLLHISSSDLDKLNFLLTRTERLLTDAQHSQQKLNIEVVANSEGIDLLRKNTSPYTQRIQALQAKYNNLQFIACKNSIQRLKKKGYNVQMIDGVKQDSPALDTIINRMDKGWTYIKI
ncbi:MAG: DsrE family protein [Gammaproteobacteria bacterium]|nr:DsrE family protein [Gammaproteobacteria bacterium]